MSEFKRSGNLMSCECGHMKAFHFARPLYYGGPLGEPTCAHCPMDYEHKDNPCQGYKEGADQGLYFRQDPRAH